MYDSNEVRSKQDKRVVRHDPDGYPRRQADHLAQTGEVPNPDGCPRCQADHLAQTGEVPNPDGFPRCQADHLAQTGEPAVFWKG